jgi:hypothetical protein
MVHSKGADWGEKNATGENKCPEMFHEDEF